MGALMHFSPGARRNDALSSHAAVAAHNASGKRQRHTEIIIDQVWLHPGLTSAELTPYTGLDRVEVARRMSDAEETGWIKRGDLKRCTASHKLGISWWPNARRAA